MALVANRYIHSMIDRDAEEEYEKADKLFEQCCKQEYKSAFSAARSEREKKKIVVRKRKEKLIKNIMHKHDEGDDCGCDQE